MDLIVKSQKSIHEKFKITPGSAPDGILMVYANTLVNSPLRRVLVEALTAANTHVLHRKSSSADTYATFQRYEGNFILILSLAWGRK